MGFTVMILWLHIFQNTPTYSQPLNFQVKGLKECSASPNMVQVKSDFSFLRSAKYDGHVPLTLDWLTKPNDQLDLILDNRVNKIMCDCL